MSAATIPQAAAARRQILRAALRDAIALHRDYTGNRDAIAVYQHVQSELADGTAPLASELGELPEPGTLALSRVICADGLPEPVLAGAQCAAPNCRRRFDVATAGTVWQVIGLTAAGQEIRACPDHRPEDILGPVA